LKLDIETQLLDHPKWRNPHPYSSW